MKRMNIYILIGVLALIGLVSLVSFTSKRDLETSEIVENKAENRTLKLDVSYGFDGILKTISENATSEIIKSTMESINWNEFHIVQLEDESNNAFKALHVSGSLVEDGLASGFVTDNDHILMVNPPESVEEMTEILLNFLKGEDAWRSKYAYE